jgi:hypothetical protein
MTDAYLTIQVKGLREVIARLGAVPQGVMQALETELYLEVNDVFIASQELVPVDTGALKSSGMVEGPIVDGTTVEVSIGYGGAAEDYALVVHEDLTAFHEPPTQAKYLEQPAVEAVEGMSERLAAAVMERLIG